MKQKIVYLIRHGQSIHNGMPVYQSEDAALSEKGERQAQTVAERLRNVEFEALLCSPLPRARQTAAYITQLTGKQPEYNDMFIERTKPGQINGQSYDDPESARTFALWHESLFEPGKRVKGGENYDDIVERADGALDSLAERPGQSLAVVTHGFFLTTMVARAICGEQLTPQLLHKFAHNTMVENTSVSTLRCVYDERDGKHAWRLWSFNDLAHFANAYF